MKTKYIFKKENRHPAEAEIEGINPKSILSMDDTDDNVKEKIEEEIKSLLNNLK